MYSSKISLVNVTKSWLSTLCLRETAFKPMINCVRGLQEDDDDDDDNLLWKPPLKAGK